MQKFTLILRREIHLQSQPQIIRNPKLCSEFAPRNREYSVVTQNGITINKLTPNNSNSNAQIEKANIPHSLFALNHFTNQSDKNLNNFERVANSFHNVLMITNSDEETVMQLKHSTPSKVRFADEAGPSTAPLVQATPSTPNTDTTTVTLPPIDGRFQLCLVKDIVQYFNGEPHIKGCNPQRNQGLCSNGQ